MKVCASIAFAFREREPLTDDLPMDRQLRGRSENRQQFGEYMAPLRLRSFRKIKKEIRLKSACAGKNKNRFSHFLR
jgi:hypothetical protein